MNDSALIYQWLGYLSNPARRSQIHIELHPKKEAEFRAEYQEMTGHPLLLPGTRKPFYIWQPSANKWGTQRRVYFFGEKESMPQEPSMFNVRVGRQKKPQYWRINNKDFLTIMFKHGFLIGDNAENPDYIRKKIPERFIKDFDYGFNLLTLQESLETRIRKYCDERGFRTFGEDAVEKLRCEISRGKINGILTNLQEKKIIAKNNSRNTYTLQGVTLLKGEIEQLSIKQAIEDESHPEKREYLIETYVRDSGWSRLAKKTFGEKCMLGNCENSFIKQDGTPYIEVHHITPLHEGGEDSIWNLSVLCAHHHRMAHFARKTDKNRLKKALLERNNEVCEKL